MLRALVGAQDNAGSTPFGWACTRPPTLASARHNMSRPELDGTWTAGRTWPTACLPFPPSQPPSSLPPRLGSHHGPLGRHPDDGRRAGSVVIWVGGLAELIAAAVPGCRPVAAVTHCNTITPCTQQGSLTREHNPSRVAASRCSSSIRIQMKPRASTTRRPPPLVIIDGLMAPPSQAVCACVCVTNGEGEPTQQQASEAERSGRFSLARETLVQTHPRNHPGTRAPGAPGCPAGLRGHSPSPRILAPTWHGRTTEHTNHYLGTDQDREHHIPRTA